MLQSQHFRIPSSAESPAALPSSRQRVTPVKESPFETQLVLASCHSLTLLEGELVGDPLEKAALNAIEWNLSKGMYM